MLRTNSKQAINNIRTYIVNNFNGENYDYETPETFKEAAILIYNAFVEEYCYPYNRIRKPNEQELFFDWCSGLPSILDTCYFYNRSAVDDLGDILEETETERNKYTEEQAERYLTYLIYREIVKEARK